MRDDKFHAIVQLLKENGENRLSELLSNSYGVINESSHYGTYDHSVLSDYVIYSRIKEKAKLDHLNESENQKIMDAVLSIHPPGAYSPDIVTLVFKYDENLSDIDKLFNGISEKVKGKFWISFKSVIQELLHSQGMFDEFVIQLEHDCDGHEWFEINSELLKQRMKQEMGVSLFPFKAIPNLDLLISLIEFFFRYASGPSGDRGNATWEYTKRINNIFRKYQIPALLKKGRVIKVGSDLLDSMFELSGNSIVKNDRILASLIHDAQRYFSSSKSGDIDLALEKINDAFERSKTLLDKSKKKSVSEILLKISNQEFTRGILDTHFADITHVGNVCKIRHKEIAQIEFDSFLLKQFFFYEYFNAVRLILITLEHDNKREISLVIKE
ncbi:MAG: hypothetical protein RBT35_07465 [Bacteroidales bacterium]|jgi:hypothetical protein|nr:hypothetical protein [Bacteroidales bacterium]